MEKKRNRLMKVTIVVEVWFEILVNINILALKFYVYIENINEYFDKIID